MTKVLKIFVLCFMSLLMFSAGAQQSTDYRVIDEQKIEVQGEVSHMSMNFSSMDVRMFFEVMKDLSGIDIHVSDRVRGDITVNEQDKPWDEIFNSVLREYQLKVTQQGQGLLIEPK